MDREKRYALRMRFEREHPGLYLSGFNNECAYFRKGENVIVFYNYKDTYEINEDRIFNVGRAIYTKNLDSLIDKEKILAETCKKTIFDLAWMEGIAKVDLHTIREETLGRLFETFVNQLNARLDEKGEYTLTSEDQKEIMDKIFK